MRFSLPKVQPILVIYKISVWFGHIKKMGNSGMCNRDCLDLTSLIGGKGARARLLKRRGVLTNMCARALAAGFSRPAVCKQEKVFSYVDPYTYSVNRSSSI